MIEGHKYMRILACHTMKGLSQKRKKVKRNLRNSVRSKLNAENVTYSQWITRIPQGQLKRIELEDKGYNDNIQVYELDG